MASTSRALTLKLLADVDNFTKNLNKADGEVTSFGGKVSEFGKKAGLAFAAAGAAAVAYAGKLAIDGVQSAIADAAAQQKLALTLENVTGATEAQIAATEDYITKTSLAFGVTDDELRPSLERLARATGDVQKAQELQTIAIDVAAGSGKSLEAVTNAMARAAEGNTASLGKLGIGLSKTELATMSMEQITAKLAKTFEGQASAKADTFQGKMDRLKIAFDEGKETVGAYILTAITPMVETIVNKVIPAISNFTSNLGEKLAPVMKIIQPIINGVTSAFNTVRKALEDNNTQLQPFYDFMVGIYNFAKDFLAPIIGKTLGLAFQGLGNFIAGAIDIFADFVSILTNIYNRIMGIINAIKSAASAVSGFFGGSSTPSSSSSSVPSITRAPALPKVTVPSSQTNITVNGAIDPEGTARTIVNVLNNSAARGTLGAAGFSTP
jgi:phage terminase small subunit